MKKYSFRGTNSMTPLGSKIDSHHSWRGQFRLALKCVESDQSATLAFCGLLLFSSLINENVAMVVLKPVVFPQNLNLLILFVLIWLLPEFQLKCNSQPPLCQLVLISELKSLMKILPRQSLFFLRKPNKSDNASNMLFSLKQSESKSNSKRA